MIPCDKSNKDKQNMEMTAQALLDILNRNALEEAEDITLDTPLCDIVDFGILLDALDFEYGVTPPKELLENWTGRDLLKFYTE
jgi:hypothetical protein